MAAQADDNDLPPRSPFADDTSDIAPPSLPPTNQTPPPHQEPAAEDEHMRSPSPFADDASAIYFGNLQPDETMSLCIPTPIVNHNLADQGQGRQSPGDISTKTEWSEVVVPFFHLQNYEVQYLLISALSYTYK